MLLEVMHQQCPTDNGKPFKPILEMYMMTLGGGRGGTFSKLKFHNYISD